MNKQLSSPQYLVALVSFYFLSVPLFNSNLSAGTHLFYLNAFSLSYANWEFIHSVGQG